jgi:hypothetical protein
MNRFLPNVLFLSSLVLFISCSPLKGYRKTGVVLPADKTLSPFTELSKPVLYRAEIDIAKNHFSGLLFVKKLEESTRLTFVTEMGMSIFDFEIKDQQIRLISIMEGLNKPALVKVLSEDMQRIFVGNHFSSEEFKKENELAYRQTSSPRYYYLLGEDKTLDKLIVKGRLTKKAIARYGYTQEKIPQTIHYQRKGLVKIRINLNKIEKDAS